MTTMLSHHTRVVATAQQVSCELADEAVILNLKDSIYYGLNEVGASIWQLVQEPRSLSDVRDALLREYDVEPSRCERELTTLIQTLVERGLIEVLDDAA